jgi:hypothetical protein
VGRMVFRRLYSILHHAQFLERKRPPQHVSLVADFAAQVDVLPVNLPASLDRRAALDRVRYRLNSVSATVLSPLTFIAREAQAAQPACCNRQEPGS